MFRKLAYASLIAASLATGVAHASAQTNEPHVNCAKVNKDGGSQYEMNICEAQAFTKVDQELNSAYAQLTQHFKKNRDTEAQMLLIKAQRAWLAWRDSEAELCAQSQGWSRGGSGYGAVVQNCAITLTEARTAGLISTLLEAESH